MANVWEQCDDFMENSGVEKTKNESKRAQGNGWIFSKNNNDDLHF